jgi:hypothetical protein
MEYIELIILYVALTFFISICIYVYFDPEFNKPFISGAGASENDPFGSYIGDLWSSKFLETIILTICNAFWLWFSIHIVIAVTLIIILIILFLITGFLGTLEAIPLK